MSSRTLPFIASPAGPTPLEPVLGAAFEAIGEPMQIERWERRPHQLADAVAQLRADPVAGALIGSPHKERAAALANALSDDARVSGSVSLLVRDGTNLRGHNTDMDGIRAGLAAILPRDAGKRPRAAVVMGAGGGARAVVAVLIGGGFQHIAVFNRHLHKAEALVAHFARSARQIELRARPWHDAIIEAELARAELLVNASGIGIDGGESPIPGDLLPPGRYVLDLVLHHDATPLMREAAARDGTVANGRASFLAGSASIVKLVVGRDAPADVMQAALTSELGLPEEGLAIVGD